MCLDCAQTLRSCPRCKKKVSGIEPAPQSASSASSQGAEDCASLAASLLLPPPAPSPHARKSFRYWFGDTLLDKSGTPIDSAVLAENQAVGVYISSFVYPTPETNKLIQSCIFGGINEQFQLAGSVKSHQRVAGRRFQLVLCTTDGKRHGETERQTARDTERDREREREREETATERQREIQRQFSSLLSPSFITVSSLSFSLATKDGHEQLVKLFLRHNPNALVMPYHYWKDRK
jgi:hypothetical protein